MSEMGDIGLDPAALEAMMGDIQIQPPEEMPLPPSDPGDEMPGACPECGAPMEGNVCQHCGYSHETPVPPENLPEPSMSAKCGIRLGKVIMHIATQALATTDPQALKDLGAAEKDWADALSTVSPPPSTVDPTQSEKIAQAEVDAERQLADAEAAREHEELKAEADHERQIEQAEVQHEHGMESAEQAAEQQAAQPQGGE